MSTVNAWRAYAEARRFAFDGRRIDGVAEEIAFAIEPFEELLPESGHVWRTRVSARAVRPIPATFALDATHTVEGGPAELVTRVLGADVRAALAAATFVRFSYCGGDVALVLDGRDVDAARFDAAVRAVLAACRFVPDPVVYR